MCRANVARHVQNATVLRMPLFCPSGGGDGSGRPKRRQKSRRKRLSAGGRVAVIAAMLPDHPRARYHSTNLFTPSCTVVCGT